MAFFDNWPDEDEDALNADAQRKILAAIAANRGKPPVLGRPAQDQASSQPVNGDSGDVFGRPTESPRLLGLRPPKIPPMTTTVPTDEPSPFRSPAGASDAGSLFGVRPSPTRPNVLPQRSDFPVKPIPTWEKVLGVAAAPFVPNLTQSIFQGPQRKAEEQYKGAVQDWERGISDEAKQAQTEEAKARTRALNNPLPKEGQTPEETTLADLMSGGPGGGPQLNPDTGRPYTRLEAFGKVEQTKTGAAQGAKQPPLDPANISQINDAHTLRYQQLNPNKPLPAALTLRPGATQQDYERIHQNLTSMESAAGVQAQREQTNVDRARAAQDREQARSDKEEQQALQPVIALDPKTKQRVFSSMGEAKKNGWQVTALKPNEEKEGELVAQLNDVQLNTSRYRAALNALKGNISQQSVNHMARILSDPAVNSAVAQNLGMGSLASIMEQGSRARDWNELTPAEQNVLVGFIRMQGAALAYQKVLTNQGRTSKEGLDIELRNMPSPILGATVGNKQLDAFQENIDTAAQRAVRLPWMETPADVKARIEKQATQQYNEQKTAPTKQTKPEVRRPISTGQE